MLNKSLYKNKLCVNLIIFTISTTRFRTTDFHSMFDLHVAQLAACPVMTPSATMRLKQTIKILRQLQCDKRRVNVLIQCNLTELKKWDSEFKEVYLDNISGPLNTDKQLLDFVAVPNR